MIVLPSTITDRATWNATLAQMPYAHILQTWEWGDFKTVTTGWTAERIAYLHQGGVVAMAQILTRQIGPLSIMYVPKGPALDYTNQPLRAAVLDALKRHANRNNAIFLKIDPDVVTGIGIPGAPGAFDDPTGQQIIEEWKAAGLRFSYDQVQFRNSVVIDLRHSEDELLTAMKQKTRYNVRLAEKRNVTVRPGTLDDFDLLYRLYAETARRDGFVIRPLDYYRQAWGSFMQAGMAQPLIAEYKDEAIAHVMIFGFAKRAWYIYGASADEERKHMPTYLLQWEAIRWAKAQGMAVYDFWGAPDDFSNPNDPMAGVFRFKDGFGGIVARRIGAWDYAAKPQLYSLYTRVMPAVLNVMRGFGRRRMQQEGQSD
ncbi:MAG: peptidoglycan bridge formation glycyltransferase FemA/FemB family protein [Anaerolineae bacterium]|nr:peptidoglycan bridge formation glycyltransferase FemA/FemB family protein [Anaerolineae bacterium]